MVQFSYISITCSLLKCDLETLSKMAPAVFNENWLFSYVRYTVCPAVKLKHINSLTIVLFNAFIWHYRGKKKKYNISLYDQVSVELISSSSAVRCVFCGNWAHDNMLTYSAMRAHAEHDVLNIHIWALLLWVWWSVPKYSLIKLLAWPSTPNLADLSLQKQHFCEVCALFLCSDFLQ